MLPAVKVFVVAALLGGGAVGTFALAGGFGPGGSGNAETTQTAATEATNPAAPATTEITPPTVGSEGGDSAVENGVQQEEDVEAQRGADLGNGDQAQQQAVLQTNDNDQDDSRSQTIDSDSSGNQGEDATEKSGPEGTLNSLPSGGSPGTSLPTQQNTLETHSEKNKGVAEQTETISSAGPNPESQRETSLDNGDTRSDGPAVAPNASNTGEDGAKGTDGEETRVASGEEETRTATGTQDS